MGQYAPVSRLILAGACRHGAAVQAKLVSLQVASARVSNQRTLQNPTAFNSNRKSGLFSALSASHRSNHTDALLLATEASLHAAMRAVATGPEGKDIFMVMVNQAAAENHLPYYLRSLRRLQVGSAGWTLALQRCFFQCEAAHVNGSSYAIWAFDDQSDNWADNPASKKLPVIQ